MDILKRIFPTVLIKFTLIFGLTFSLQLLNVQAAATDEDFDDEYDDEDETEIVETVDWRIERDAISKEIEKYVDETVAARVTRDFTSKFITRMIQQRREVPILGNFKNLRGVNMSQWEWPIDKPNESLNDIVKAKTAEIVRLVNIEFPDSAREQFPLDAQKKYEMFQINDHISIILRQGFGTNTDVNGIFSAITSERVMIGTRYVSRRDLDLDTEARFYKEQNTIRIDEYIRRENDLYDSRKDSRIEDLKRQVLPTAFHTAGYVPNPFKPGANIKTAKEEFWIARYDLHTRIFNTLTQQAKKKLTAKCFAEHRYVLAPNEKNEIEWMPQQVAEQYMQKKDEQERLKQGAVAQSDSETQQKLIQDIINNFGEIAYMYDELELTPRHRQAIESLNSQMNALERNLGTKAIINSNLPPLQREFLHLLQRVWADYTFSYKYLDVDLNRTKELRESANENWNRAKGYYNKLRQ